MLPLHHSSKLSAMMKFTCFVMQWGSQLLSLYCRPSFHVVLKWCRESIAIG
jgi:hypothetical protein